MILLGQLTIFRVLHVADDVSDYQLSDDEGRISLPNLSDSQLVHYHFFRILNPDFQDFVLSITLQEADFVPFLD